MTRFIGIAFLFTVLSAGHSGANTPDTSTFAVKIAACKPSGDYYNIKWENHLVNVPDDSIEKTYPLYVVAFIAVTPPSGFALGPTITIGDHEVTEYGGGDSLVFFKVYTDSVLRSFAGKPVVIWPAYPQDPFQKGAFPDPEATDSLISMEKQSILALPNLSDVLSRATSIRRLNIRPQFSRRSFLEGYSSANEGPAFNLRGQKISLRRYPTVFLLPNRD